MLKHYITPKKFNAKQAETKSQVSNPRMQILTTAPAKKFQNQFEQPFNVTLYKFDNENFFILN